LSFLPVNVQTISNDFRMIKEQTMSCTSIFLKIVMLLRERRLIWT